MMVILWKLGNVWTGHETKVCSETWVNTCVGGLSWTEGVCSGVVKNSEK